MENENNESVIETTVDGETSGPVAMSETTAGDEKKAKEPETPAWKTFMAAIDQELQALGLQPKEQKNFVQIEHAETGQRIYVAKQVREVTNVPTTLPLGDRPGLSKTFDGENGKISAEIEPTVDAVREALRLLASGELGKVRPSKRMPKAEKSAETPAVTAPAETPETEETAAANG